mgnify:FL=1
MKRNYFNQITTLLLVSLIIVFVSCKKDKLTEPNVSRHKDEVKVDSKAESIVKRIKTFERQLDDVKRGVYRNDSYIDIDSAMWNIESLFNTTFSMPDENYVEKKIQELTFDIGVHRDNKLSMYDVTALYDDIIRSVKDAYINDGIESDKGLMSIVVGKNNCDTRAVKLKVTVITGRTNTVKQQLPGVYFGGPFKADECWYYGEFGGSCDDPFVMSDAAEQLEKVLNINCGSSASSVDNENIYVDLTMISLKGNEYKGNNGESYMFYKVNSSPDELYLTGKELNEYYNWEKQIIFNEVLKDPKYAEVLPEDPTFIEINIDGLSSMSGKNMIYYHHHDILYGTKCEVPRVLLGSPKNILNY